jgi:anti-sigma factor RsiW
MTCRQLIEFLGEFLDGGLSERERVEFERHLSICASCVAYLQNYQASIALGKAAFECEDEEVPPDVPADLVEAILAARAREAHRC